MIQSSFLNVFISFLINLYSQNNVSMGIFQPCPYGDTQCGFSVIRIAKKGKTMIKKKRKNILLIFCFAVCLYISCCTQSSGNRPQSLYIVSNINGSRGFESLRNSTDEYFFGTNTEICQFSISEQEIIDRFGNGESIHTYAVCDDYIFFLTNKGRSGEPEKIWRYDRESRVCELYIETKNCTRMIVYDGFLFYGHDDIYACPVDGNPEENCVSLMEQFQDTGPIVQN